MICFTSCQKDSSNLPPTIKAADSVKSTVATGMDNTEMLKLVNDSRKAGCMCGVTKMPPVAPLKWNDALASAALVHSKDMNATGQLIHNSSDGTTFSVRITNAGYIWSFSGENIAFGQTTEQLAFGSWITSEGHCKNIMNATFKDFGAARDGLYWTQDFGAPQ